MLLVLWLVFCPWSITVQIHGWRRGKLVFLVLFNLARGFENVCEIISDYNKWKPRKKFSRSYLQKRKMEKPRQKELLTTWECLNYKTCSQQLPSCVIAMRDSLFCKCSHHHWRWKSIQRNLIKQDKEKKKKQGRKIALGLKKMSETSTNPRTVKRYEAGMCIGLFSFLIIV